MYSSSPRKGGDQQCSPEVSPTQLASTAVYEIAVHSVMEGVKDVKLMIPVDATVYELKRAVYIATEVTPDRQLLLYNGTELRDNMSCISDYGIMGPCTLTMNVKMNTGILIDRSSKDCTLTMLPLLFPSNSQRLRQTIRTMTDIKEPRKGSENKIDPSHSKWTPEKQAEHILTRNRMKCLLQRRRRKSSLALSPPSPSSGSVCSRSPPTEPASPGEPSERSVRPSSTTNTNKANDLYMTEKELKFFFEPPESEEEMRRSRQELFLVPETAEDLEKIKKEMENWEKTVCSRCRRKLKLSEQEIRCMCNFTFCKRHREPSAHNCVIDYKGCGRSKITKENPKVKAEKTRKAQI
nr:Ubiquitin and Zinc finger domain containing protein [Haemonchus contortus]